MSSDQACWTADNCGKSRTETLRLTDDGRCFFKFLPFMGTIDEESDEIEIAAMEAVEWCRKNEYPIPRALHDALRIQEAQLTRRIAGASNVDCTFPVTNNSKVKGEKYEVFDIDAQKSIVFDEWWTRKWGPVESGEDWSSVDECFIWSVSTTLFRHESGKWLTVEEKQHFEAPWSSGRELKRIAPQNAAKWLIFNGFELPQELMEFGPEFEFDPSIDSSPSDVEIERENDPTACERTLSDSPKVTPLWDKDLSELRMNGEVIRRVRGHAKWLPILDSFQEFGWPTRIDSPFPPSANLREYVRTLNDGLIGIRFECDGTTEGIRWRELTAKSRASPRDADW